MKLDIVFGLRNKTFCTMRFKQIAGFVLLVVFVGFFVYKFIFYVSEQEDGAFISFLVILILIILFFAIRKIIVH